MLTRVVSVVFALVVLTGCAGTSGGTDDSPPKGSNSDNSAEPAAEKEPKDETPTFGQAYTWEDGITVKISKPASFKPSEYSSFDEQPDYLKFGVKIVNKSGKTFDVNSFNASLQSGNEEMEQVFDSENGFNGPPATKLLDGRESKFVIGFGAKDVNDLVLQVTPDFEHEAVLYTS